jgi:mono/diheme cytochrome c family protein
VNALVARALVLAPLAGALALGCAACDGSGGTTTRSSAAPPQATTTTKADLAEGKAIYTASCAGCHALAAAGATGTVGPNLDTARPSFAELVDLTTNGRTGENRVMPAFGGALTAQQIQEVAAYVASVAGK